MTAFPVRAANRAILPVLWRSRISGSPVLALTEEATDTKYLLAAARLDAKNKFATAACRE